MVEENREDTMNIIEALEYYINNINTDNATAYCMFVDQNIQRKKKYKGYNLNCDLEKISSATLASLQNAKKLLLESEIKEFDFEFGEDGVIQTLPRSEVVYTDDILNEMSIKLDDENTMDEEKNIDNLDFTVIRMVAFQDNVPSLVLFKKQVKAGTAFKKSVKVVFEGKSLKLIPYDILAIGENVEAVLYNGMYYILNRRAFDSMFHYKEGFKKIVEGGKEEILSSGMLSNAERFINDCMCDGRYLPRLAKALYSGCFKEVARKIINITKIKERHNIALELSENGIIQYKGAESIPEILNIFLDHYVVSPMTDRAMLAKAIESYEAGKNG